MLPGKVDDDAPVAVFFVPVRVAARAYAEVDLVFCREVARNLQAEAEPDGEREVLRPVEAGLHVVENSDVDEVARQFPRVHFSTFIFFFDFGSLYLVDFEDGLVEVECLADEWLEDGNVGDAESERNRDIDTDVVVVDAVFFFGRDFVVELFVMVRCSEADAECAAIVEVPAQVVVERGLVPGFFFEVFDVPVVLRVVAVFVEVAVGEFHDLVEDAVFLLFFLVVLGGIGRGGGLRACLFGGLLRFCSCLLFRLRRGFGCGRHFHECGGRCHRGLVFDDVHLEQREFPARVGDGVAALALRVAAGLHGVGDGTGHVFAQQRGLEFQEAVGDGALHHDFLVERDEGERVLFVRLALAGGLGHAAENVA